MQVNMNAMVASALSSAEAAERLGLPQGFIILSKIGGVELIAAFARWLRSATTTCGLTEASLAAKGIVVATLPRFRSACRKESAIPFRASLTPWRMAIERQADLRSHDVLRSTKTLTVP